MRARSGTSYSTDGPYRRAVSFLHPVESLTADRATRVVIILVNHLHITVREAWTNGIAVYRYNAIGYVS